MTRAWIPFATAPFTELRREMDRLFDTFGAGAGQAPRATTFPAVNVWEDADNLHAEAEIPGVSKDDLEVYAIGNELVIKGRRNGAQGESVAYHRQERGTGDFTRVVTLPIDVQADKVDARLHDGVLSITLPKVEAVKPRKISVQAG
jgi:HSP20 family protein